MQVASKTHKSISNSTFNQARMKTAETLIELEKLFIKNLIPIRPNRSFKRDTLKYRKRKKPPVTKNFKPAF